MKANGQFGTRHSGGKDAAAARYIYTELQPWVTKAFPIEDMPVLNYSIADGHTVEPVVFVPIIPTILINGVCGLGTGWVSDIPQFNPLQLIDMYCKTLSGMDISLDDLKPWTKNHLGEYKRDGGTLKNTGVWTVSGDTLTITELPVGVWTEKIESQLKNPKSKLEFDKVEESHTDTTVQFVVKGVKDMKKMIGALKLTKTVRENYVVFMDNRIVETTLSSILHDHSTRRLELYKKRKAHQLNTIKKEEEEAEKKMKFIQKCIEGKIPLTTASNMDLIAACLEHSVDEKYLDINLRDLTKDKVCLLYTSPSPRDRQKSRMPSSA